MNLMTNKNILLKGYFKAGSSACRLLDLHDLCFDPDDGGGMFIRNISCLQAT
jgi:hypothetical protein